MRSAVVLSVLLFSACGPATAVLLDGDALDDTDIGDVDTSDADTGDVDTGDVDTEADTEAPPRVYTWTGERTFLFESFFGDCTDNLIEHGVDVTNDPEWADAREGCASCNLVFVVEMDKESLCAGDGFQGYAVQTTVLRGLGVVAGEVVVFSASLAEPSQWSEFARPDGDWGAFTYEYEGSAQGAGPFGVPYTVEGEGSAI